MKWTILGAGKGGHAAAGHVKLAGEEVTLWNRPGDKIDYLIQNPHIEVKGKLEGRAELDKVTDSLEDAVRDAEIISIKTTTDIHTDLARKVAPYLHDGQRVLLNCGGMGGSLLFLQTIRDTGYTPRIIVGETDTCTYGCKVPKPGESLIKSIKNRVDFSSVPIDGAEEFLKAMSNVYPQFRDVKEPLASGFDSTCFHTAGMVLNRDRIARAEDFNFYIDGVTPEIGEFMEAMDSERLAVANAMGIPTQHITQWLNDAYDVPMGDLHQMLKDTPPYQHNAPAPKTFQHRYLLEEIPTKVVPVLEMATILGIPMPKTRMITDMACDLTGVDLYAEGRTLDKLGLLPQDILTYRSEGLHPYLKRQGLNI